MKHPFNLNTSPEDTLIAVFVPSLVGGGAERNALLLAKGFADRGLKVDLVLTRAIGSFIKDIPPEVRIIDLAVKDVRSRATLLKLLALMRYLQREKPNILLSCSDYISIATWARRFTRVPTRIVIEVNNSYSQSFRGFKGKLKPYLLKLTYPWADAITAESLGSAEDAACMAGIPLNKIQVIYNPVIREEIYEKAKEPVDHPWLATEIPIILGVGRLVEQKDFSTLIRAFALVRQHYPARLIILGEGTDRPQLEALIRELGIETEIFLPGFADNPYAYMAKASVFVLSSAWEGFGNVLVEAMAVGNSVVSTNCKSGPAEILENGKYGQLVSVGDVNALAKAILATLNQPTDFNQLRKRAMEFSVDRAVDHYLNVFGATIS